MDKIKWLGTAILLVTAALTSFNVYPLNLMVGCLATITLGFVAYKQKDTQYLIINTMFIFLNVVGILSHYSSY